MARLYKQTSAFAGKLTVTLTIGSMMLACTSTRPAGPQGGNTNRQQEDQVPVIPVTTAVAVSKEIPAYIQATGTLVASETSNIAPKVAGKVTNVGVNIGDYVSQGALIVKIDDRDAKLQLIEAQAAVKQAEAGVRQAEARIGLTPNGSFAASKVPEVRAAAANVAQMEVELRQLEANEKRYHALVETGDVPMMVYENHRSLRDVQRARVATAKEQLDATVNAAKTNNQAIVSAQASLDAAKVQVKTAEQAVIDTVVRAPFSGYISDRPVAVGEFVSTATVLATLLRTNPIKIQIQVAEADVPTVKLGAGVSIEVPAYRDRRFSGVVTAINPAVDPTSRSAVVEASIENGDNALRPGMFATARINREGGTTGVFIPKTAVYNDQATQSYRAFVIVEGVAKLRVLQLGTEEGDSVQIMDGIAVDEVVATSNLDQLYEGAKVAT
jgi:multidrug efflux pump subunit AcrA (membrane-fusion protein)